LAAWTMATKIGLPRAAANPQEIVDSETGE
jgi:hypothetical protein